MNRKFLGDAYDCWKGWLIKTLQDEKLVSDLVVDPMFTDPRDWGDDDLAAYARLLHVERGQIISHACDLANRAERAGYFKETEKHHGDLFLDPDTGIYTGTRQPHAKHVTAKEIRGLLPDASKRLIMIYQHAARAPMSERVDEVTKVLQKEVPSCTWASYESATAAMLFVSRTQEGPRRVAKSFGEKLGSGARSRIRNGGN